MTANFRPFGQSDSPHAFTEKKRVEKLRFMHRNPVKRGLVRAALRPRYLAKPD
jgi:hypothetical protein